MRGLLFALDGIDGAGKSTLANRIAAALTAQDRPNAQYVFPTHTGAVGKLIRKVFSGEERVAPEAMLLLMSADAIDTERAVQTDIAAGKVVIMDRYTVSSSWAYQTEIHALQTVMSVVAPERHTKPNITFIIDIPVDMSIGRLQARGGKDSYYENVDRPEYERRRNRYLAYHFMNPGNTMIVDGQLPLETNTNAILAIIKALDEQHTRSN